MRNWLSLFKCNKTDSNAGKHRAKTCDRCASPRLQRTIATYPVALAGKLSGKRIDVYRVELDLCKTCGHLMPTPDGKAKIKRCVKKGKQIFLNHLK
jgi:hypothetical protein